MPDSKPPWLDQLVREIRNDEKAHSGITKSTPVTISIALLCSLVVAASVTYADYMIRGRDMDLFSRTQQVLKKELQTIKEKQTELGLTIIASGIGAGNDWKRSPQMEVWCRYAERENTGWQCPDFDKIPRNE